MNALFDNERCIAMLLLFIMTLTLILPLPTAAAVEAGDLLYSEGFGSDNTLTQNGQSTITAADNPSTGKNSTDDVGKPADNGHSDSIAINLSGNPQAGWDLTLPSIAEMYKDYFDIGNIMNAEQTKEADTTAMFRHHYTVVTAENDMKPQSISTAKGVYNFSRADAIVEWAQENNIKVHGHTLVWHSQSARWLNYGSDGRLLTRAEARANMEEYIRNVAGHFKGKVISWDVVNEAFSDGTGTGWKNLLRKDAPWYMAYENGADASKGETGADYIYDAFVFTRLADPEATLYYNDYNETVPSKREAIAAMVEELNKKWKNDKRNTEPGRLLIEGIGMQAHYWTDDLSMTDVEASIKRFITAGVRIAVTELDIPYGSYSNQKRIPLTEAEELNQAMLYAQLFEVYKKYGDNIDRVTFWGKADSQSWRFQGSPLLFDNNFSPKQSYYAVIDSEGFLLKNWKSVYKDVNPSDWFFTDVAYVTINKLMQGTGFSTYSPADQVTWGQFLVILYRLDGQTGVTTGQSWNVESDAWAVVKGLVKPDFRSDALLNRQDMAVIIKRYLEYANITLPENVKNHTYADDADLDEKAKSAVELLYNTGIITGKPGNLFDPKGFTNRAEIAAILHRLVKSMS